MVNRLILVGKLGRDAETRYTGGSGDQQLAITKFSVATEVSWSDRNGQRQRETEWTDCVWMGRGGEALGPHLTKGRTVYVEGAKRTWKWEAKDGSPRTSVECRVQELQLLGDRPQAQDHGPTVHPEPQDPQDRMRF